MLNTGRIEKYLTHKINSIEASPFRWFFLLGLFFAYGVLFIYGLGKVQQFNYFWNVPIFWVFCVVYFIGILSLKMIFPREKLYLLTAVFLFSFALINAVFSSLNSSYFSSGFSEGSWIFSAHEYIRLLRTGIADRGALSNPTLDPTRIFFLAVPFLFNIKSLLVIRIYNVLLRLIVTFLSVYFVVKRLKVRQTDLAVALTLWGFLLINYIDIGAHLLFAACLVIALTDTSKPVRTLCIVALASIWAGLSRINWFPVPAMIAILIYIFEKPFRPASSLFRYFAYPFLIGVTGVICSCTAYYLYCHFTGTVVLFPNSAYRYFFIHSRLLPNNYFLPGTLLASILLLVPSLLPVFITIVHKKINIVRILVAVIFIIASFVVALQISSKIGGGYDMHNYDIVFLIAFITLSYVITGHVVEDIEENPAGVPANIGFVWELAFILAFVFLGLLKPYTTINLIDQNDNMQQVQQLLDEFPNGNILFITDQNLPAMGLLNVNHPVYDFDYAVLTEMLMARNNAPVNEFIETVDTRRYTLIVAPNMDEVKFETNGDDPYAQENNLWEPFDEQFSARYTAILRAGGVVVYAPIKKH